MRGRKLTIAAAVSLAALAVLLCGYLLWAAFEISIWQLADENVTYARARIQMYRGTVYCGFDSITLKYSGKPTRPFTVRITSRSVQRTWLAPALWSWDAGSGKGYFYLTAPLWGLAVLCTIAPLLWLRRRRRNRARGFPVLTAVV